MKRTIEGMVRRRVPLKPGLVPVKHTKLIAEWQDGPQTICGLAPRKLRLVFAPLPLHGREPA